MLSDLVFYFKKKKEKEMDIFTSLDEEIYNLTTTEHDKIARKWLKILPHDKQSRGKKTKENYKSYIFC